MATKVSTAKPAPGFDILNGITGLVVRMYSENPHEAYMARATVYILAGSLAAFGIAMAIEPIVNK